VPDDEPKARDAKPESEASPSAGEEPAPPEPAEPSEDKFRPEAIAARVDMLGEETELDRIAREEERKLLDRKKQQKKKGGLETAASKRLAKIGEGTVKRPSAIASAVTPEADPLLEHAARASKWIREHGQTFGALVAIGVLGVGGFLGWVYWQDKRDADASALLARAFADEHGHIGNTDEDDDDSKTKLLYPTFKSAAERRDAALAKYRAVEGKYSGTGAAILARLAEASLLLDEGDAKGAAAAYEDVKASPLAQADGEVRGRALEGIGFADELLAESDAPNKDRHLADALGAFQRLEQVDVKGFKELGMYHQARVLQATGDQAKAVELLKDVHKRVTEPGESHPFSYLEFVVEDRLRALDPSALPPKAPKGAGGNPDLDNPQYQELLRQLKQRKGGGGAPVLPMPGAPP
jgi:hypothetical protein